jgi:hypothetical protein
MNKALLIAATLVSAVAVAATAQETAAPPEQKEVAQNKMICRAQQEIGSRLRTRRVCRTKLEWDEITLQQRQATELGQVNRQTVGN